MFLETQKEPTKDNQSVMAGTTQIISFRHHEIYIGSGFLNNVAVDVVKLLEANTTVYIISNIPMSILYGENLICAFQALNIACKLINQSEEDSKILIEEIENASVHSYIVLLGSSPICEWSKISSEKLGNCIGIAIIPTTLRGFVNIEEFEQATENVKNQKKSVFIDVSVLRTLPRRHCMSGMSEIIKVALIYSDGWKKWTETIVGKFCENISFNQNDFLEFVELNADLLISASEETIVEVVTKTLQIKSQIISASLNHNNPDILSVLKLGKCIGEAIREVHPELLYGECIAIGMVKEAEMYGENICSFSTVGRLVRCLKRFELPYRVPENLKTMEILAKLKKFPKNVALESIQFVLEKQISIVPGSKVSGSVRVPGSKSITNRVLLMAAMGRGTCHLSGILHSDDTQVMINALERIGTKFKWINNNEVLVVNGTGGNFSLTDPEQEIFVNHSGTSARFLTTFLTLVESDAPIHLTGSPRMKERPIGPLVDALRTMGCSINYLENDGCLPLAINHTGLKGGLLRMSGKISSTFVTSVLMGAPYASKDMIIELEEEIPTSLPYILMTIQLMAKFNIHVQQQGLNRYIVPCGVYENPSHLEIEVDASSATYPLAMAAVTGGTVCALGLGQESLQGDAEFCKLLERMGCTVVQSDNFTTVTGPSDGSLQSVSVNMASMTDAFMTAAVCGAVACGITQLRGISNQRVKECNRIEVMVNELNKIGIPSGELEDGMWVEGIGTWNLEKRKEELKKSSISCHNDHRIAMSFAVLGCVLDQIIITDKECTEKTYPSFWEDCRNKLGLTIQPHSNSQTEDMNVTFRENPCNNLAPCVIIIGMRGCGKSVLGLKASKTFQWKFIDMDILLEELWQETLPTYVNKYGLDKFRHEESQLLKKLMNNETDSTIICCGGGVVESELSRMLLKNHPHVVYIERNLGSIILNLSRENNPRRIALSEPIENVYNRRLTWYEDCSKFKFVVESAEENINQVHAEFERFLRAKIPNVSRV